MLKSLLAGLMIAATMCAAPARAQDEPDARAAYVEKFGKVTPGVFYNANPQNVNISLVRLPSLLPGQFAVRLSVPDVWISCAKTTDIFSRVGYEQFNANAEISHYQVDMLEAPKEPQFGCERGYQNPSALIVIDRGEIERNNIAKLRIWNGNFINRYVINLTPTYVSLTPSTDKDGGELPYTQLKKDGVIDTMKFWFYPQNTVILYAPGARANMNLEKEIRAFAANARFTPLEDAMPGFRTPLARTDYYYYVDETGAAAQTPGVANGIPVGSLSVETKKYELAGDSVTTERFEVYAKTPGIYE